MLQLLFWRAAEVYPYAFGLIWPLLIIVAIVLIASAMRRGSGGPPPPPPHAASGGSPALDILEQRYARGEIDRDEFLERRAVLMGADQPWAAPPPPPPPPPTPPSASAPTQPPTVL